MQIIQYLRMRRWVLGMRLVEALPRSITPPFAGFSIFTTEEERTSGCSFSLLALEAGCWARLSRRLCMTLSAYLRRFLTSSGWDCSWSRLKHLRSPTLLT